MTTIYKPEHKSAWSGYEPPHKPGLPCYCHETMLTQIKRRDWDKIITDLVRAGLGVTEIGKRIGRTHGAIVNWREPGGREPKESDARKLLALHRIVCGSGHG